MIVFHNYQKILTLDKLATAKTVFGMICAAGYRGWGISVTYIEDKSMQVLNRKYRGKDASTDILSFPSYTKLVRPGMLPKVKKAKRMLGDIFISTPYIQDYCLQEGIDLNEHFRTLYAHGISHLLGFDHEKDEDYVEMAKMEERILKTYTSFEDGYDPLEEGLYESWNWDRDPRGGEGIFDECL